MDSPNPAAEPESAQNVGSDRTKGRVLAIIGLVLMALPFLGLLWAIYGMASMFLGPEPPDSETVGASINMTITTMLWGLIIGAPGVIIVLSAVLRQKNREWWFYRGAVVLSAIWCILFFPMGILIGGYLLFIFISRKGEFITSQ